MSWWITALQVVFGFLVIVVFFAGVYFILSLITKGIVKRRYKRENDIGRRRQEFGGSISNPREVPGIRMESSDSQRIDMENTPIEANGPVEQDIRDGGEEPRVHSNDTRKFSTSDYEYFKKHILSD